VPVICARPSHHTHTRAHASPEGGRSPPPADRSRSTVCSAPLSRGPCLDTMLDPAHLPPVYPYDVHPSGTTEPQLGSATRRAVLFCPFVARTTTITQQRPRSRFSRRKRRPTQILLYISPLAICTPYVGNAYSRKQRNTALTLAHAQTILYE